MPDEPPNPYWVLQVHNRMSDNEIRLRYWRLYAKAEAREDVGKMEELRRACSEILSSRQRARPSRQGPSAAAADIAKDESSNAIDEQASAAQAAQDRAEKAKRALAREEREAREALIRKRKPVDWEELTNVGLIALGCFALFSVSWEGCPYWWNPFALGPVLLWLGMAGKAYVG